MIDSKLYENIQRGTPDFPIDYFLVDSYHSKYLMQSHWHKDYEIIKIFSGSLNMKLNNITINLNKNDGIFIPGGVIHSAIPDKCEYRCLVAAPSVLYSNGKCRNLIKTEITRPVSFSNNKTINELFSVFEEKKNGYELNVTGLLYKLCSESINAKKVYAPANEYKIERIKAAITYVEEHYSSNITLSDLAETCMMSSNYFCKFFKEVTSQSPMEYINIYRIECACNMLKSGMSVTDTALNCGFNDLSYFIHVFKKYTNYSPKQYVLKREG